ncbi:MAG: substrate-binding domain-containing protein [Mobilitalea sp.]
MAKKMNKLKKNRVISAATLSSVAVGIIIILIGMSYYKYRISELGITDTADYQKYEYHYAIISEEADVDFWEAIYQGALEKGKEQNIYVEKIGSNLSIDYTLYDLMKIAITSKVDGIILEPNGDADIVELINEASDAGIPVITVMKDEPNSKRKSFVGINTYNQGQAYSKEVLKMIDDGKRKIMVLLNADSSDTADNAQTVIYSSIIESVGSRRADIESTIVNTQSTFSSEEDIRNIIMDKTDPPDVLVCLTAVDTICARQAVVDYNKVGEIDIIGYYDSDIILRAIQKNIVHSTMTIDARQMGAYCVEALTEFRETSRVSDYYSVDISVIDKDNVADYIVDEVIEEVE